MKVLKDYVLVKEIPETEKKSEGGILLSPDKIDYATPVSAEVIEVGKDVEEVKVGDTVMYMPKTGIHMQKEDYIWRFLKEEQIIAVL